MPHNNPQKLIGLMSQTGQSLHLDAVSLTSDLYPMRTFSA